MKINMIILCSLRITDKNINYNITNRCFILLKQNIFGRYLMKKYLINNNSDNLLLFFTGWGCDESEFEHLSSSSDVLMLYDYSNLDFEFDFSKYKKIDLIAFSAGVFIASVLDFDFEINKRVAISGNPYLFDEILGLSSDIQEVLSGITEENADDFAKNYLIKTDAEWEKFHHSRRTPDSCRIEYAKLKDLYGAHKNKIKDIFDSALFGEYDKMFNINIQKEFYKDRLYTVKDARHNFFFKINKYEQIFDYIVSHNNTV